MERLRRTGAIPTAGLIVHCPWCGARMAGSGPASQRVCVEHGWFIINAAYGPDNQRVIKVKTL